MLHEKVQQLKTTENPQNKTFLIPLLVFTTTHILFRGHIFTFPLILTKTKSIKKVSLPVTSLAFIFLNKYLVQLMDERKLPFERF